MQILVIHDRKESCRNIIRGAVILKECYYKNFLKCFEVKQSYDKINYDYFFLLADEEDIIEKILEKLEKNGIHEEKILVYKIFKDKMCAQNDMMIIDEFLKSNEDVDAVILGMSHAKDGIKTECFHEQIVNLAIPSIDLFYMKKLIGKLAKSGKLSGMRFIIIELPYYMFNWDISRSRKSFERFEVLRYFGDFHHMEKEKVQSHIQNMQIIESLVQDAFLTKGNEPKKLRNQHLFFRILRSFYYDIICQDSDSEKKRQMKCQQRSNMWEKLHEETLLENEQIWKELILLIRKENPQMQIYVTILPHNPIFFSAHSNFIKRMKRIFYEKVRVDDKLIILDSFNSLKRHEEYFKDDCHLNGFGAYMYTIFLKRLMRVC